MINYIVTAFIASLISVMWIHPRIVRIARDKNIVDNPNARKLQAIPIPVLGGVAVFFGIIIGLAFTSEQAGCMTLMPIIISMMIMLYTGTMDDIIGLTPGLRFLLEIGVVVLLICSTHMHINDFHGLWGIRSVTEAVAIPLTIFAAVGIINSINLIDGVNGLSSGYCILASAVFGIFFYQTDNAPMVVLATVSVGSLIPFFLHNVFGKKSKMFIGDGGALVMGLVMSAFVVNTLTSHDTALVDVDPSFGLVPFTLAVMIIPVADTLRVMLTRIMRGTSPFHPDKTHLHHLFIGLGFSHAGTTTMILLLNAIIISAHLLTWRLGGSINAQFYVVVGLGIMATVVLYHSLVSLGENSPAKKVLRVLGRATHIERKGMFLVLQRIVDKL